VSRKRHQTTNGRNRKPKFGSKAWVANALKRKFRRAAIPVDGKIESPITTLSEYLSYRKLHRILWPRTARPPAAVWVDPPWLRNPETRPPDEN